MTLVGFAAWSGSTASGEVSPGGRAKIRLRHSAEPGVLGRHVNGPDANCGTDRLRLVLNHN